MFIFRAIITSLFLLSSYNALGQVSWPTGSYKACETYREGRQAYSLEVEISISSGSIIGEWTFHGEGGCLDPYYSSKRVWNITEWRYDELSGSFLVDTTVNGIWFRYINRVLWYGMPGFCEYHYSETSAGVYSEVSGRNCIPLPYLLDGLGESHRLVPAVGTARFTRLRMNSRGWLEYGITSMEDPFLKLESHLEPDDNDGTTEDRRIETFYHQALRP